MFPSTDTRDAGAPEFRRAIAAAFALILGLLGVLVSAPPAHAAEVLYSGVVLDQSGDTVAGIPVVINGLGDSFIDIVVTDADGAFSITLEQGGYFYRVDDGAEDGLHNAYAQADGFFGDEELTFTVNVSRYVEVSGTIMNWAPAVGPVQVTLWAFDGASWVVGGGGTSTDGTFSFLSPIDDIPYTLEFRPANTNTPLLGAFLRGESDPAVDDPEDAITVTGEAGSPWTGIETYLLEAAAISGTVTTGNGATPLAGIEVWADDEPTGFSMMAVTDADGHYTLYVRPGPSYTVSAYDSGGTYASIVYDGWDGCGCFGIYTPVSGPATGIDFDLPDVAAPWTRVALVGILLDDDENLLYDVDVRLYRQSGNGWVRIATMTTYEFLDLASYPINFGFSLEAAGDKYRLQFADGDGQILRVVDGGYLPDSDPPVDFDPVPACYASLGTVSVDTIAVAFVDPGTAGGDCAELPRPTTPGGSGGGSTPRTTPNTGVTATPTPSPTPTPSATPTGQPSTDPTPSVTPSPEPTPASTLDMSWLLWVLLAMLVVLAIGAVVFVVRRA